MKLFDGLHVVWKFQSLVQKSAFKVGKMTDGFASELYSNNFLPNLTMIDITQIYT